MDFIAQTPASDSSRASKSAIICSISSANMVTNAQLPSQKLSISASLILSAQPSWFSKTPPSIYRGQQNVAGRMYLGDPKVPHEHETRVLLFLFHESYSLFVSALML